MRRLFILRPEPGASASAARARAMGLTPVVAPLFEISPIDWETPERGRFDGLLLTSASAVRCAGDRLQALRGVPVYAVGEATAAAAREAGFGIAATGDSNADALLRSIEPDLKLLHLCGIDRTVVDPPQHISAIPVYRAEPSPDPELSHLEDAVAAVHSPRAGQRLAELVDENRRGTARIAAISAAAAAAVGDGWRSVDIAEAPSDKALLALAARLCEERSK